MNPNVNYFRPVRAAQKPANIDIPAFPPPIQGGINLCNRFIGRQSRPMLPSAAPLGR